MIELLDFNPCFSDYQFTMNRTHSQRAATGEQSRSKSPDRERTDQQRASIASMRQLAWLLDDSIPVPILGTKIGLDGLIGLVPGIGDLISAGLSTFIIRQASIVGVPKIVLLRMATNSALDLCLGAIPLIGDLLDFGFKANKRNVDLVIQHFENPQKVTRHSWLTVVGMILLVCFAIGLVLVAFAFAISLVMPQ